MRILFRRLLALVVLFAASSGAHAYVQINVDLVLPDDDRAFRLGPNLRVADILGKDGHPTPRGVFRPRALYPMAHSSKYGNAPMPHSIFFYGQYAIHGTLAEGDLGRPASHGCIRLSPGNAATLFAMVQRQGAIIRIVGSPPSEIARGERRSASALSFAPIRHTRTLNQWARDPLAR